MKMIRSFCRAAVAVDEPAAVEEPAVVRSVISWLPPAVMLTAGWKRSWVPSFARLLSLARAATPTTLTISNVANTIKPIESQCHPGCARFSGAERAAAGSDGSRSGREGEG